MSVRDNTLREQPGGGDPTIPDGGVLLAEVVLGKAEYSLYFVPTQREFHLARLTQSGFGHSAVAEVDIGSNLNSLLGSKYNKRARRKLKHQFDDHINSLDDDIKREIYAALAAFELQADG